MRALLLLLLLCPLAHADDDAWAEALHTEFEAADLKRAAELYRAQESQRAHYRLVCVLAKARKQPAMEGEAKRFLERFPKGALAQRVRGILEAPERFVAEHMRKRDTENGRALRETHVSLSFDGAPLREVTEHLTQVTGLAMVLLGDADPEATVSATVEDVSARSALRMILAPLGLSHETTLGAVVIGKAPAKVRAPSVSLRAVKRNPDGYLLLKAERISLSFADTPLEDALKFLDDMSPHMHQLAPEVDPNQKVSLLLKNVTREEGLTLLAAQIGCTFTLRPDGVRFQPAD